MDDFVATDLHGHSFFSDGKASPEEYVAHRAERGFEVIALSDHDTFAGVPRAAAAAEASGMVLVPAMETSSFIHFGTPDAEQIHVLAYFPPSMLADGSLWRTVLARRMGVLHRRWREHVLTWLDGLPPWDAEPLDPHGELRTLVGAEFPALQSMIELVHDRNRVLLPLFHAHQRHFLDDPELFGWTPEQLIEVIRADGALDVVAHSARARDRGRMQSILDFASGVEVYTSRHQPGYAAELRAWAEARGKHWTASSDDHQRGTYAHPPCGTPRRTVERIVAGSPADREAARTSARASA